MSEDSTGETNQSAAPQDAMLALGSASREKADAYLDEQIKVAREQAALFRLQIEDIRKEDRVRHWSLRVRHIADVLKLAFQFAIAVVGLAAVFALACAIWLAAHDGGLVIEAFNVPPDMAQRGLTGQVVAAQLQDKLAALQTATASARPADSFTNNWDNDIKVEIPNTGVSVGEFYRYLTQWLGHQTRISGEVFRTAAGISLTARAGDSAVTLSGSEAALDRLLQQAAEKIYRHTQPYRYAMYLETGDHPQLAQARDVLQTLAIEGTSPRDRAWAHIGLATIAESYGAQPQAVAEEWKAIALAPNLALAYANIDGAEGILGHDEQALAAAKAAVRLLQQNRDIDMSERSRVVTLLGEQSSVAVASDDFNASLRANETLIQHPDYEGDAEIARETIIIDQALLHDGAAVRRAWRDLPPSADALVRANRANAQIIASYWTRQWPLLLGQRAQAETDIEKFGDIAKFPRAATNDVLARQIWPYVATALAMTGDPAGAHALIDKTPLDCVACLRNRADIAAAGRDWAAADYWFGRAVLQAPSIPMGYFEWGRMLLLKGDADAAIAKFALASLKGPRFADPLEGWGEALMKQNHSGRAVAKFAQADKYAPNWGRLHLKWGEALIYAGQKDEAKKQFAIASRLDLSAADKAVLAKWVNSVG